MLENLDLKERIHADTLRRAREIEREFEGPDAEEIVLAVLQSVDLEEQSDASGVITPEGLVFQAEELLRVKGKRVEKPAISYRIRVGPLNPPYNETGITMIEVGGREVKVNLGDPLRLVERHMKVPNVIGYGIDMGLRVGDNYQDIRDALLINDSGVHIFGGGPNLTAPQDLQRVSRVLTKIAGAVRPR